MKTYKVTFMDGTTAVIDAPNITRVAEDLVGEMVPLVLEIKLVRRVRKPKVEPID